MLYTPPGTQSQPLDKVSVFFLLSSYQDDVGMGYTVCSRLSG